MIDPVAVRYLPGGSMIIGATWAAYRQPTEPHRFKFWQVTGSIAKLSDAEMGRYVQRALDAGDDQIMIVRNGDYRTGATAEDLSAIRAEVNDVLMDQIMSATHSMPPVAARGVEERLRRQFISRYPRLARLLADRLAAQSPDAARRAGSPT